MQKLYNYAVNSQQLAQEAIADITDNEIASLRKQLTGSDGFDKWTVWRLTHSQDISEYMAATPSQRRNKKQWQHDQTKLILAAYWGFQLAAHVLEIVSHDPVFLVGGSYRAKAADVATLFPELAEPVIDWWPWDDDPFV